MILFHKIHQAINRLNCVTGDRYQVKKIALYFVISTLLASTSLFNIKQVSAEEQAVAMKFAHPVKANLKTNTKEKLRIAVLDFDYSSVADYQRWMWWLESNARGVSDILVNQLVEGGNFVVVERSKLDAILSEQNLGASGRIDVSTAAKIGKILGVDAVVIGSITGFNLEQDGGGISVPLFGRVGGGQTTANVKLNVRLVNTSTAEILMTAEGNGQSNRGDGSINIRGYGLDTSSRKEAKLLTTATVDAVTQVVQKINNNATTLAEVPKTAPSVTALVADISGKTVIINKGLSDGYRQGMKLSIQRVSREVKDPATGKVIRQITQAIGMIEITEADNQSSVAKVISGAGFKVGDVAKPAP
ncbi:MAG: penicillin-binding protein activator LpoB [Goleter apudmare HA4340-LM2]|nr:penicillin-binding protein activator LpoB [Goleter apudmare HA4340-LM2]